MRSPVGDYLLEVTRACAADDGEVADYIPELADADPDRLAIALVTVEGEIFTAGDADHAFTIQSISKPFTYALALADRGVEEVLARIDVEPSGDAFNEISLESETGRPRNPMINAGAIAAHALVRGEDAAERARRVVDFYGRLAGRDLAVDESVFASEMDTAYRNMAIGYMLRTLGVLDGDPTQAVEGYVRQCSVSVTVADLARMAAVLATGGLDPRSGERLLDRAVVRQVLAVMTSCGMYDSAGDWLSTVGIPAKSGVSGGIIGVLPGQVGIAVLSPRLDRHGNSSRGVRVFERLSRDMGLHLMEAPESGRSAVRREPGPDGSVVYAVQGDIRFVEATTVLAALEQEEVGDGVVVLDLGHVHDLNDVGRRMVLEGVRRLQLDGHPVRLVDPGGALPARDVGDADVPDTFASVEEALADVR